MEDELEGDDVKVAGGLPEPERALDPDALYRHLLRTHANRRICCSVCGTRYSFDNLNMCRSCGCVFCGRCAAKRDTRRCECGGQLD